MSWLARSIANSLRLDEEAETAAQNDDVSTEDPDTDGEEDPNNNLGRGGVKEDLSEIRESFTRQLRGVASFLAPPPPLPPCRRSDSESKLLSDYDNDDDRSSNNYETEIEEEEEDLEKQREDYYKVLVSEAIGITDEVLAFARNIAHHPETWLDFSLSEDDEFDDCDISDTQYKHALAVEHLSPRLAALRNELCPAHMTEGYFWMVYFVLLHSRLNKHDADLLSSPQIVEARAMWMQELHKKTKEESYLQQYNKESSNSPRENYTTHPYEDAAHIRNVSDERSPFGSRMHHTTADRVIEKHPCNEVEFVDKSVITEEPAPSPKDKVVVSSFVGIPQQDIDNDDNDDEDDWVNDDSDLIGYCGSSMLGNEEDISFSDLEDDTDCSMPVKSKNSIY